jgi:Flp pilus assembly pilin Flp
MTSRWFRAFREDERGQDALEYILASGTLAVLLAVALFGFRELVPEFVGHECPGVDTAADPPPSHKSCVVETP